MISGNAIVLAADITADTPTGIDLSSLPITLAAPQTFSTSKGGLTIGAVDLGANTLTLYSSVALGLSGVVSGTGGLIIGGNGGSSGTSAVNTYTGPTSIPGGFFACSGCLIPGAVNVTGGVFRFSSGAQTPTSGPIRASHGGSVYVDDAGLVAGDLTLDSTAGLRVRGHDPLTVHGSLSLGGSLLDWDPPTLSYAPGQAPGRSPWAITCSWPRTRRTRARSAAACLRRSCSAWARRRRARSRSRCRLRHRCSDSR